MLTRETALELLAQSHATGPAFFNVAVEALAKALGCRWAGVGLLQPDSNRIKVLAFWDGDALGQPFEFDLQGTPCEVVYGSRSSDTHIHFPDHVDERFPQDADLARLGVKCYHGELFCDTAGKPAGHVFALNNRPGADDSQTRVFFRLVSQRVGAEYNRWQSERALQAAEERYRALIETQTDLVCRFQPDTTLLFVNSAYAAFFGKPAAALVGTRLIDLLAADDAAKTLRRLGRLSPGNPLVNGEARLLDTQGKTRWFHWVSRGIFNEQGMLLEIQSVGRDINDRKRTEQALRVSEERFRQIAETIDEVFYIAEPQGPSIVYISPGYEKIWGRPITDFYRTPDPLLDTVYSADRARVQADFERKLQGQAVNLTYRIERPDGTLRWIKDRTYPLLDSNGHCYRIIGIAEDISTLKQTEAALFAEKELAQITLRAIGDAVITTDTQGVIQFLNPSAEKLTGWQQEEATGRPVNTVLKLVREHDRLQFVNPISDCLASGQAVELIGDTVLIDRQGREYAIEDSAAPIRSQDGVIVGAVLIFRDVTETRQMRQQLKYDATHDPLTGLINRREFEKRLQHALDSVKQYGTQHVLCFMDLDHFKIVNDTAGHAAGDQLLRSLKDIIWPLFRDRDTLSRLGGDEFGLLLDNCPLAKGLEIAENILTRLRAYTFSWQGQHFQIGASIGVVEVSTAFNNIEALLNAADTACYTAKKQGRDQVYYLPADAAASFQN